MIGFFYEIFLETGWILLPLFILGFWGWWELVRFLLQMFANRYLRKREFLREPNSELSQLLLPSMRRSEQNPPSLLTRFIIWLFALNTMTDASESFPAAKQSSTSAHSYEYVFFKILLDLRQKFSVQAESLSKNKEMQQKYRHLLELTEQNFQISVMADKAKRLTVLRIVALAAPLLGLLGTVTGMIDAFEVISSFGNSNPLLLASGISKALLTTQAGLTVAFPLLLLYVLAKRRFDQLSYRLRIIFNYFYQAK